MNHNIDINVKFYTPFIYALFLVVGFFLMILLSLFIGVFDYFFSTRPPFLMGVGDIATNFPVLVLGGVLVFTFANFLIENLEKMKTHTAIDHVRQSSLLYLLLLFVFYQSSHSLDGYFTTKDASLVPKWFLVTVLVIACGIIVNAIFLYVRHK